MDGCTAKSWNAAIPIYAYIHAGDADDEGAKADSSARCGMTDKGNVGQGVLQE
jgi:hypothetical protein